MIFEEVKANAEKKNGELINLFEAFLAANIEVAEIKDWEDTYKTFGSLYNSCITLTKTMYNGKVKVSKCANHIFIKRVAK